MPKKMWIDAHMLAVVFAVVIGVIGPTDAYAKGFHTPVSSDGSIILVTIEDSTGPQGESPFEGTGEPDTEPPKENPDIKSLLELESVTSGIDNELIIGGFDSRVRVYTTTYPARAVVLITFNGGRCTGWLYGPDIVATAGHCVHTGGSSGTWRTNVKIWPGYNGTDATFGSCRSIRLYSVTGWTNKRDERFDYGSIKLNCAIGNTTGWFGYWWQDDDLTGLSSMLSGVSR